MATESTVVEFGISLKTPFNPAHEAIEAERSGFAFVAAGERVTSHHATNNAMLLLATAGAVTERIGLMSAVTLASVYPPVLLAKMAACLSVLTEGRFELGIGIGGENPAEIEACGFPPGERGARATEAIEIMQQLWRAAGPTSFAGPFTSFKDIIVEPGPQKGSIPIWMSGRVDAAIRRAAKYKCNWLPYMFTPGRLAKSLARFREIGDHRPRAGVLLWTAVHEDPGFARAQAVKGLMHAFNQDFTDLLDAVCLVGTPDTVSGRLQEYIDAGATRVLFNPCAFDPAEVDEQRSILTTEVLSRFPRM